MALVFPATDDQILRRAPLVVVLTQVKFPQVLTLLAEPGVVGFQEAIRETYPTMAKVENTGVTLGPTGFQAERHAPQWRFANDDDQWVVTLSIDSIALESLTYTNADDFLDRFDRIIDALDRTVHPARSTRIGFRKVNELIAPSPGDPRQWRDLLNPALVGIIGDDALPGEVVSALSILRLRDELGDHLVVQHGIGEDPTKYRMDLDYSTERPTDIKAHGELRALLRTYAASETQFFVWSLHEDLYGQYEPTPRPTKQESP